MNQNPRNGGLDKPAGGVTVLPYGSVAFKVEGKAARPESDYSTYKVFVRWAKDVDTWP